MEKSLNMYALTRPLPLHCNADSAVQGETKFENAVFCVFRFDNVAEAQNAYMALDDGTLLLYLDK